MNLQKITSYLDELYNISKIEDGSLNGLQVENNGTIDTLSFGVDISGELVSKSPDRSLIIVHHGLFWAKSVAITRNIYKIIHSLISKDCALYTVHLPMDLHEQFGNNHGFYKLLKWDSYKKDLFGLSSKNSYLSSTVEFPQERDIKDVMEEIYGILGREILFWDFGKKKIKRVAFVSGAAAGMVSEAINKKIDLYISGETSHTCYWMAKENNINMISAGHYNTEKIGLKLLGKHMEEKFAMNHRFIDLPTGL